MALLLVALLFLLANSYALELSCTIRNITRNITSCDDGRWLMMDTVILNDVSCPMPKSVCKAQQRQIADTLLSIKSTTMKNSKLHSRVAYVEFDDTMASLIVPIQDARFNSHSLKTDSDIEDYYKLIKNADVCSDSLDRTGNVNKPHLLDALELAEDEFDYADKRDKKLIIFTNCPVDEAERENICVTEKFERYTRRGTTKNSLSGGVSVVMVNNGDIDETYMMCLARYDPDRILSNNDCDEELFYNEQIEQIKDNICENPTPAPTTDPTSFPSAEPTAGPTTDPAVEPTPKPTAEPTPNSRRRMLSIGNGTKATNGRCIKLRMEVEVENILPTNNNPDACLNIALIAQGAANASGGYTDNLRTCDDDDDATPAPTIDDNGNELEWSIPVECRDENQVKEDYWPKGEFDEQVEAACNVENGVVDISYTVATPGSLAYVYKLDHVSIALGNPCPVDDLIIEAIIYDNDNEALSTTATATITAGDTDPTERTLVFAETVTMEQGLSYKVEFTMSIPSTCTIITTCDDLLFPEGTTRRRLADDGSIKILQRADFSADATPDSCTLCQKTAQSEEMQKAIDTLCYGTVESVKTTVKQSLFQSHVGQSAMKKHLVSTGSLHISTESGTVQVADDFPKTLNGVPIYDPCIAIDEENGVVYSVGGKLEDPSVTDCSAAAGTCTAVDTICAYQFDNEALTEGHYVTELKKWRLKKARYGAMCAFWKKDDDNSYLVVSSGMLDPYHEFASGGRANWYNDVRLIPIPKEPAWFTQFNGATRFSYPKSASDDIKLGKNLIDAKPLFVAGLGNIMYLVGGKTHSDSQSDVQRVCVDALELGTTSTGTDICRPSVTKIFVLNDKKAMPLIDQIEVKWQEEDGTISDTAQSCYMFFGGQEYTGNAPVGDSSLTNGNLQVFCNDQLDIPSRRRMGEDDGENVAGLTEFDRKMWRKYEERKRRRRRRLAVMDDDGTGGDGEDDEDDEEEKTAIYRRRYDFQNDGIWYNFEVTFDICYDSNVALNGAEEGFDDIIESKDVNGSEWRNFTQLYEERILSASEGATRGWSIGFGDVRVIDLEKISVNYVFTPAPTESSRLITHPQRRKARFWWRNIDRQNDSYVWIDDKVDDD